MSAIDQAGGLDLYAAFAKSGELLFSFTKAGVTVAKVDDAAITAYAGANDAVGKSVYTTYQGGGTSTSGAGKAAGDAYFTGGAGSAAVSGVNVGGTGTSIVLTPGAGGAGFGGGAAGAAGKVAVRAPTGYSAGVDEVYLFDDGSQSFIGTGQTRLYVMVGNASSYYFSANAIIPMGNNSHYIGDAGNAFSGMKLGEDSTTIPRTNSGLYLGLGQEARLRYEKNSTGYPASCLILGVSASGTASVDRLALSAGAITGFAGAADVSGSDTTIGTQSGGAHTTNNPRGGNLTFQMGAPAATGTGVHGYFSIGVGALGNVVQFGGTNTARALGFFGVTPVIRATALTVASVYAWAGATNVVPWGFASEADANAIVSVLQNVVTRLNEAETRLKAYGLFI